jgi:homogentisate 1,2-dioxygenase
MVTVHPVGLPHGPKPPALKAFMEGRRPEVHHEVGVMADFANPTRISEFALGLSQPGYMASWSAYVSEPTFTYRPDRLAEIRAAGERLADARDALRPPAAE